MQISIGNVTKKIVLLQRVINALYHPNREKIVRRAKDVDGMKATKRRMINVYSRHKETAKRL